MNTSSFENVRLRRIADQESVLVAPVTTLLAGPALPEFFKQDCHDI